MKKKIRESNLSHKFSILELQAEGAIFILTCEDGSTIHAIFIYKYT